MNISEGNKLIAEFMGLATYQSEHKLGRKNKPTFVIKDNKHLTIRQVKYHSSWDWLMPVVAKISNECEEPEELDGLKYALLTNNIEEAWEFVVSYLTN